MTQAELLRLLADHPNDHEVYAALVERGEDVTGLDLLAVRIDYLRRRWAARPPAERRPTRAKPARSESE